MATSDDIFYRISDQDEIIHVSDTWDRFAAANGGERVRAEEVLNRPLWDFVSDRTTRELYRQVLNRVRDGRALKFSVRCDAPACRRRLEVVVTTVAPGVIEFRTHTLAEESRQPQALLDAGAARSADLLRVCSWCCRIFVEGAWIEMEEAINRLQLLELPLLPTMTHGICDPCYQRMRETLA